MPRIVVAAMRTAYATHVRNLLELFHEGSPGVGGGKAAEDIEYELVDPNPYGGEWTQQEKDYWNQATQQLASHLSGGRPGHGKLDEWENRGCEEVLMPMDAVSCVPA